MRACEFYLGLRISNLGAGGRGFESLCPDQHQFVKLGISTPARVARLNRRGVGAHWERPKLGWDLPSSQLVAVPIEVCLTLQDPG
jgi:hypothetical protein